MTHEMQLPPAGYRDSATDENPTPTLERSVSTTWFSTPSWQGSCRPGNRIARESSQAEGSAMTETDPGELGLLGKLVTVVAIVLIVAGVLWYGVTVKTFARSWHDLVDRTTGPMKFRLILQPSMAAIAGIRKGLKDARIRKSASDGCARD
jgi:hypothetical protein